MSQGRPGVLVVERFPPLPVDHRESEHRLALRRKGTTSPARRTPLTIPTVPLVIEDAYRQWLANQAYIDGRGNYHVKSINVTGPIAPWNKAVKRLYATVSLFHDAAHAWQATTLGQRSISKESPLGRLEHNA
jgi:hypothetical protein